MAAIMSVTQAPSGTLVKTDEIYAPSKHAIVNQSGKTRYGLKRHTNIAASETMHVSKKVTNMTHTPYALPREVV
jgi:hypothetical protein